MRRNALAFVLASLGFSVIVEAVDLSRKTFQKVKNCRSLSTSAALAELIEQN